MSFAQNLFRRHTLGNRDGENGGDENTQPDSATGASQQGTVEIVSDPNPNVDGDARNPNDAEGGNDGSPDDQDEEQELIVQIPNEDQARSLTSSNGGYLANLALIADQSTNEQTAQIQQRQRREAILKEVERIQRANFIHFCLLCLVPTSLLLIVIAAIVSEDGECGGDNLDELTVCEREARTFVNAFTTRCICDAIRTSSNGEFNNDD